MEQDIETRFLGKLGGGLDKVCSFHLRRKSQVCVCVCFDLSFVVPRLGTLRLLRAPNLLSIF